MQPMPVTPTIHETPVMPQRHLASRLRASPASTHEAADTRNLAKFPWKSISTAASLCAVCAAVAVLSTNSALVLAGQAAFILLAHVTLVLLISTYPSEVPAASEASEDASPAMFDAETDVHTDSGTLRPVNCINPPFQIG